MVVTEEMEQTVGEKEAKLSSLKKQIEDLEYRIGITENPGMVEGFQRDIQIAKSQLSDVENEISALKDRING